MDKKTVKDIDLKGKKVLQIKKPMGKKILS